MFTKFGHVLQAFGLVAMEAQLRNIPVDPWAANGRYFKRLTVYPFFFLRAGGGGEGWLGLKRVSNWESFLGE